MSLNKKLVHKVHANIQEFCKPLGFVPHPSYAGGWDRYTQVYHLDLVHEDVSGQINEFSANMCPRERSFNFVVKQLQNKTGLRSISDITSDPHEWHDIRNAHPFTEFTLFPKSTSWVPFSSARTNNFKKSELADITNLSQRICSHFEHDSMYLFDAMRGTYTGRRVSVRKYDFSNLN